jgi:hypothetical protein
MSGNVRDGGTGEPGGGIAPSERAAVVVEGSVIPVAPQVGEIDAADKSKRAVDDHQLLVVAVHGSVALVQSAADPRVRDQIGEGLPSLRACRMEEWNRSARPQEHTHVDALRCLGEQVAERDRRRAALHGEVRVDRPAGDVHR